jgi:hypothetical protein
MSELYERACCDQNSHPDRQNHFRRLDSELRRFALILRASASESCFRFANVSVLFGLVGPEGSGISLN